MRILRENESKAMVYKDELKLKGGTDIDPTQIKLELNLLQRKYDLLEDRENQIQKLISIYAKKNNSKDLNGFIGELSKILTSKPKK